MNPWRSRRKVTSYSKVEKKVHALHMIILIVALFWKLTFNRRPYIFGCFVSFPQIALFLFFSFPRSWIPIHCLRSFATLRSYRLRRPLSPSRASRVIGDVGVDEEEEGARSDSGTNSKLFSLVKLDRWDKSICFGMVGFGSTFCFRTNCHTTKIHMDHKVPFSKGKCHIVVIQQRAASMSAYPLPYLDAENIPRNVWRDWSGKSLSLPD